MIGSGLNVFAVWNYVIAKTRRGVIELNPELLAFILGCDAKEIQSAITFLCSPDKRSRSKDHGGRRLIQEGEYQYRVVNWKMYDGIKSEADRREYNRRKQAEYRATQRANALGAMNRNREKRFIAEAGNDNQKACDQISGEDLPGNTEKEP